MPPLGNFTDTLAQVPFWLLFVAVAGGFAAGLVANFFSIRYPDIRTRGLAGALGETGSAEEDSLPPLPMAGRTAVVLSIAPILSAAVAFRFGMHVNCAVALVLTWFLLAAAVVAVEHMMLPDMFTLPCLWVGLLVAAAGMGFVSAPNAIAGTALGWFLLKIVQQGAWLWSSSSILGNGDAKLAAAAGAWIGPMVVADMLLAACVLSIGYMLLEIVTGGGRYRRIGLASSLPFGPFLAFGAWVVMIVGLPIYTLAQVL